MITKTDFMHYLECPIWLWLSKYKPELIPEDTDNTKRRFAIGNEIDQLSKGLFLGGIEIEGYNQRGWENTQKALASNAKILYQPTVVAGQLACRADILTRNNDIGGWDINEVKSATSVKTEYPYDLAFQKICFENAGIKIGRTNLIHINNEYIRQGDVDINKLFTSEDITEDVEEKLEEVKEEIKKALTVLKEIKYPNSDLIKACINPRGCEYIEYYSEGLSELYSIVDQLPQKHILALLKRGILNPKKISAELLKSIGYEPEKEFTIIDALAIKKELKQLEYPLYFFDYETYGTAIPPFNGTRPYQNIPFQYSLLIKENPSSPIKHKEFLMRKFENPVPSLLAQLKRDIGTKGSVIVWFASFEMGRNEEMALMEPVFAKFLKSVNDRVFDLMTIFKNKAYSKSEFQGSASLKAVLPVLCPELSYDTLAIHEGGEASSSWPVLTSDETSDTEKTRLAKNMLAYCKRDTEAMVGILDHVCKDINIKI
jgi:hypothetical protein